MKAKVMLLRGLVGAILALAYVGVPAETQATPSDRRAAHITFEASSADQILYHPETILADPDRFWGANPTYRLVAMWHRYSREAIPHKAWIKSLTERAAVPAEKRPAESANRLLQDLMASVPTFREKALPHICAFLPRESQDLRTTIHFTAETHPRAFQLHDHIVLDVTNWYFGGDADAIMNCLVHEVFHIGFGHHQRLRRELDLDDAAVNEMLNSLQNEGMATYVAYTARHIFPAPEDRDYAMLARKRDVRIRHKKVNDLFRRAQSENPGDLRDAAWHTGIKDRGFYVLGAYMAQMIDERLGRAALVATVETGPRAFVRTYNEVADERLKLIEFAEPVAFSRQQRIRAAALDGNAAAIRALLEGYTAGGETVETALENTLISAASVLQERGDTALAIEVLEANVELHPQSTAAYQFLADAYARGTVPAKAAACYRKCIALDPEGICAFNAEAALQADPQLGAILEETKP